MNAELLTATRPDVLRHRATATAAMIALIDQKLARLGAARRDRADALNRIRAALILAEKAGSAAPEHERTN